MRKNKPIHIFFLILSVVTVLFIWANSCLGRGASSEQSGVVRGFLQNFFELIGLPVNVTMDVVRKIAHFAEFFLLGVEITLYTVWGRGIVGYDVVNLIGTVFAVGFVDETIQIFSKRGPAITDVWLDVFGGVVAIVLVIACYYLSTAGKKKRSRS